MKQPSQVEKKLYQVPKFCWYGWINCIELTAHGFLRLSTKYGRRRITLQTVSIDLKSLLKQHEQRPGPESKKKKTLEKFWQSTKGKRLREL